MDFSRVPRRRPQGVALIVVLAFVVLLTGLIVAYFSRAMIGRRLSNNSAGQMRASVLAQSAADTIIAGFKQEIKTGSTVTQVSPNASPSNLYVPTANANAVPVRYPTPGPNAAPPPSQTPVPSPAPAVGPIPNLVRESVHGDSVNNALPSPAVPSYASDLNSATKPAVDGHTVSPARWNSHFLIPTNSTATITDSTPDTSVNFTAPDWVLVTRNGPAVQMAMGSGAGALNDATPSNGNFVIGRYAYAVYDEGGLLDMNVAGHPTPGSSPAPTGFTVAQVGRKGSQALADLTQLPLTKAPQSSSDYLPQSVVDSIVGWRNNASAGLTDSSYPNFTFSGTQAANWFANFVTANGSGYLKVYGGAANNQGATDQALLSRQQLLKLRASLGFSANVLQYMGTFSRGLEQPSYQPDANRPTIIKTNYDTYNWPGDVPPPADPSIAAPNPPHPQYNDIYYGNNDAVGADDPGNPNPINSAFLSVRVQNAFTRADVNKTPAVVGEPLVKRRFALSRLAEIRYDATDTTTSLTDPNAPAGTNHINDWFGLSRQRATDPWVYNHGSTHIMTLTEVAAANREPDFAELLKAAINTGSLGKAGPNLHNYQGNYQYALDVSVDFQVIQIMANLIDQSDNDSFPTVINVNLPSPAGTVTRTARGIEDLPYFYRYHTMGVVTRTPSPLILSTDKVDFYYYSSDPTVNHRGSLVKTIYHCKPNVSVANQGEGEMLFIPGLWNPHDATQAYGTLPGPRPSQFRVTAITDDPLGQSPWITWSKAQTDNDWYSDIPDLSSPNYLQPAHAPLTETSSAMVFGDNNGKLFREPTMVWRADAPAGINLSAPGGSLAGPYADVNFGNVGNGPVYYGICMGKTGLSFSEQISSLQNGSNGQPTYVAADPNDPTNTKNLDPTTVFLFQTSSIFYGAGFPAASNQYDQLTFRLEYADPTDGHWVIYDEKYPDFHSIGNPVLAVNVNDINHNNGDLMWPRSGWANPLRGAQLYGPQLASFNNVIDPRTARFGVGTSSSTYGVFTLEPTAQNSFNDDSDNGNQTFGQSKFTVIQTQRPASALLQFTNYSNPGMSNDPGRNLQMRWFSGIGYSAANTAAAVSPLEYDSLFAQNNPSIAVTARGDAGVPATMFYEDPDGIARRAMGAYADPAVDGSAQPPGLPLYTANDYTSGTAAPNANNASRPVLLNRPFRSVAEMGYAFRGTPWKQLDFFTPESGDSALLDVFCVSEPPADGMVAGKVSLNTHQVPVLKALLAGTARDEAASVPNFSGGVPYPMAALDATEAEAIANRLVGLTTDAGAAWRGPLVNVAHLVGRYVANPGDTSGAASDPDFYTFNEPASNVSYTYAGFSAALNKVNAASSVVNAPVFTPRIQRFRAAAMRGLADAGQTRVWNLLIDVIVQTGRYGPNAGRLDQFSVDGEQRCWVHVAIDRLTGEIIDKQMEAVTE